MYIQEDMLMKLKKKADAEKTTIAGIVRNAVSEFLGKEKTNEALCRHTGVACA